MGRHVASPASQSTAFLFIGQAAEAGSAAARPSVLAPTCEAACAALRRYTPTNGQRTIFIVYRRTRATERSVSAPDTK